MAVNPIQFLVAQNASITDGTKTITISGNVDCSRVYSGTAVFLGGADNPAEAVTGTAPDGSGNSTITLRNNWSQGDVINQQLVSFNTNEGLAEAISNVREIVSNVSAIEDLATEGLVKRIDDNTYEVISITALGESLVGANDASTARSVLGLGSAATKNVGTASGNVMEVGAFGLGGVVTEGFTDFNEVSETSFIGGNASISNAPPWVDSRVMGGLHIDKGGRSLQIMPSRFGDLGFRTSFDNVYGDWQEIYHSGNSVNPLDYGLGRATTSASLITDFSLNEQSGFYRSLGGYADAPETVTFNSSVIASPASTGTNFLYQRNVAVTSDIKAWLGCTRPQTGDVVWAELYHSGNSVNPLDYGLSLVTGNGIKDSSGSIVNDLNLTSQPNQFFVFDSATANRPINYQGNTIPNGVGITLSRDTNIWGQLTISRAAASLGETVIRAKDGANIKERTLFDSGNTNFNEFGGVNAGDVISTGIATSATEVRFFLPINSKISATGITLGTGLYSIKGLNGADTGNNNLTLSGSFSFLSGNKVVVLIVTGLSGLTQGGSYRLETESVNSVITVNF